MLVPQARDSRAAICQIPYYCTHLLQSLVARLTSQGPGGALPRLGCDQWNLSSYESLRKGSFLSREEVHCLYKLFQISTRWHDVTDEPLRSSSGTISYQRPHHPRIELQGCLVHPTAKDIPGIPQSSHYDSTYGRNVTSGRNILPKGATTCRAHENTQ